jgi:hypothetical protein
VPDSDADDASTVASLRKSVDWSGHWMRTSWQLSCFYLLNNSSIILNCVELPLILHNFLDFVHTSDIMCKLWRWNRYVIELLIRCSALLHVRRVLVSNSDPDFVSTNILVSLAN